MRGVQKRRKRKKSKAWGESAWCYIRVKDFSLKVSHRERKRKEENILYNIKKNEKYK
jgi:hypothetical protein